MAQSVGQVALDLVVNDKGFNKQISSIAGIAKKAGGALAKAFDFKGFDLKGVVDFGKECLDLGSDLTKVQNVVDVTFTSMNKQVNDFAQSATNSFGLSETMAKKYVGTFGAMSKAFGFNEKQAYDMSTALTGLTGDVASFYNINQEDAFKKLRSVFTGETESLKDLGVVMTQTALDQFALANGFGKTTSQMTEQEKVALRFAFVQRQLALASGDFARNSDSWANQTQILKQNFDNLKSSIGQGLIAVFTPVINFINIIMAKLVTMASVFKDFISSFLGIESDNSGGIGSVAGDIVNATTGMEGLQNATSGVGSSAKKAVKEIKGLMGFDEVNSFNDDSSFDDGGAAGGAGGTISGIGNPTIGNKIAEQSNIANNALDGIINKAKELSDLFVKGFKIGLNGASFDGILNSLGGIKESLVDIFTSKDVGDAANRFINTFALSIGKYLGALTSIGITIGENIFGGIDNYLASNNDIIKNWLVNMFDIRGQSMTIASNFSVAIADIFSIFRGDTAQQITANVLEIFSSAFMGVSEIIWKFGRDALNTITAPFIENKDAIKEAIENTLEPIKTITGSVADFITESFGKLNTFYDEHIAPFFTSIKDGFSSILETILDVYNNYIAPIFQSWGDTFSEIMTESISPFLDKFLEFAGKVINAVKEIWEGILVPFINWLIESIIPDIAPIVEFLGNIIMRLGAWVADVFGGIIEILGGIIDFLVGVFTGDWEKVWDGIVSIVKGILDTLVGILKTPLNGVIYLINKCIDGLNSLLSFDLPDFLGGGTVGISIPHIPKLAKGGIVTAPTLTLMGEQNKKEAVLPLERNTGWMDIMAEKLSSRMGQTGEVAAAGSGEVNLQVGVLVADDRGLQKLKLMLDGVATDMKRGRR